MKTNTKKGLLILLCGLALSLPSYADGADTIRVEKLKPLPPPIGDGGDNEKPKAPALPPVVALDGHTLYIISGCDDTVLSLADENETEAYSITILAGTTMITLPEWLQGTYELRILRGQYMFYTEIEL